MKRVLIVSPNFPPVSAPDMQRVRLSLPYFVDHGWQPYVLAVGPDSQDRPVETALLETIPRDVLVARTRAIPLWLTRRFGVGNVALRAFGHLGLAGWRLIRQHDIDLVYFSTTMFAALPLGRLWKAMTGVPYVIDLQDPWVSDYLAEHPEARPPKHQWSSRLHARLEPFTMRAVGGIIAVSERYLVRIREKYPSIEPGLCRTIPFGASSGDFEVAERLDWQNPFFARGSGQRHVVSVGRGGADMATAARIVFRATRELRSSGADDAVFWFVGTDYAPAGQGQRTLEPLAAEEGVADVVHESPDRVGFLEGLRLLREADVLLVIGSTDPAYSPSKIYPYLLAGRPVVAVLHEDSPVADLLRRAGAGPVVTFASEADVEAAARCLAQAWRAGVSHAPRHRPPNDEVLGPVLAPELTRQQCEVFDAVLAQARTPQEAVCVG